jgi:hypothetical protein
MSLRVAIAVVLAGTAPPAWAEPLDVFNGRNLHVAGREFIDVPAAIDPGETASDLNLGTSILRDFIITTDFADGAIWLEPRNPDE